MTPSKAARYWGLPVPEYLRRADVWPLNPDGELIALIMIESPVGLKNLDEILSVPGVGAIFLGTNDLSYRQGLGLGSSPEAEESVQKILKGCLAKKVICGLPGGNKAAAEKRVAEGFKIILGGGN